MVRLRNSLPWMLVGFFPVFLGIWVYRIGFSTPGIGDLKPSGAGPPATSIEQIAMVFVGSSTCAVSGSPQVHRDVDRAASMVSSWANSEGMDFHRIGVAVAPSAEQGLEYLGGFGPFDEVLIGPGFYSIGLLRYVIMGFPGPDVTPQLLVAKRQIGEGGSGIREEHILLRLVGIGEIGRWVDSGSPIEPETPGEG